MSDPVQLCVVVKLDRSDDRFGYTGTHKDEKDAPTLITWGYEHRDSWGAGQTAEWQEYSYDNSEDDEPKFYGYVVAGTWHGVILFNPQVSMAISDAKDKLRRWFKGQTPTVMVRGYQR